MKKIFPLWLDDSEIKDLKNKSKKENRSVNNFVKFKCEIFKEAKQ